MHAEGAEGDGTCQVARRGNAKEEGWVVGPQKENKRYSKVLGSSCLVAVHSENEMGGFKSRVWLTGRNKSGAPAAPLLVAGTLALSCWTLGCAPPC